VDVLAISYGAVAMREDVVLLLLMRVFTFWLLRRIPTSQVCHPSVPGGKTSKPKHQRAIVRWENHGIACASLPPSHVYKGPCRWAEAPSRGRVCGHSSWGKGVAWLTCWTPPDVQLHQVD